MMRGEWYEARRQARRVRAHGGTLWTENTRVAWGTFASDAGAARMLQFQNELRRRARVAAAVAAWCVNEIGDREGLALAAARWEVLR
jgi:hypothetical protein